MVKETILKVVAYVFTSLAAISLISILILILALVFKHFASIIEIIKP